MDASLIITLQNGARVYQGAAPDDGIIGLDPGRNLLLVEMAAGIDALHWVRQGDLVSVLYFGIDDSPQSCLSDGVLLSLAAACSHWLLRCNDVLFGCAAGISRSSYADCATLMTIHHMSFDDALALIRTARPQANPNEGFVAQLRRLQDQLWEAL